MNPNSYASDVDYDAAMGHSVDSSDWCLIHGQRKDSCGPCVSDELEMERVEAMRAAIDVMLDKIDGRTA